MRRHRRNRLVLFFSAGAVILVTAGLILFSFLTTERVPDTVCYTSNGDGTCTLSFVPKNASSTVTVPQVYNGEIVTAIGEFAFSNCNNVTEVILPASIREIEAYSFSGCKNLSGISLPEGITELGAGCFSGCPALKQIAFPSSLHTIGKYAFTGCSSLTELSLNGPITTIGEFSFSSCEALTSIVLGENVTYLGDHAFYRCAALKTLRYEGTLQQWCRIYFGGEYANPLTCTHDLLIDGESVTSAVLPEGITSLKDYTFVNASKLNSIYLPEGLVSIGICSLQGCDSLVEVNLPSTLTSIGNRSLFGCAELKTINYPKNIESWRKVIRDKGWNTEAGNYTIFCTDATVDRTGLITMKTSEKKDGN